MEIESLEVYARDSNFAIIKPPGRNFPGCVIQGDSLAYLCRRVRRIVTAVAAGRTADEDFRDDVQELNDGLIERILHYQAVLAKHGIGLPYPGAFTPEDLVVQPSEDDGEAE